jgi:hypothetical protein
MVVHIDEGLHNEVHVVVDEALAELLQLSEPVSSLVKHLDVLTRRNLSSLLNALSA